ncbi:MAG: PKD domain-containing protein [Bacteroidia bacterium]|nr:PKD domain-containing protein [Bacteroidia bacterium]
MIKFTIGNVLATFLLLFLFLSSTRSHGQSSMNIILARCVEDALNLPPENRSVSDIRSRMRSDGSFSDRSADIFVIEDRILKLAQAYKSDPNYRNDVSLKNDIYLAWNYWNNNYDLPKDLANWTVEAFRLPRAEGLLACLLKEELDRDYGSNGYARAISDYVVGIYDVIFLNPWERPDIELAANYSSRFRGGVYIAAFANNEKWMQDLRSRIDEVLEVGAGTNTQIIGYPHAGITPDYSFHQHNKDGGQMIWGNYGTVFLDEFGKYMRLVSGTDYDLNNGHYQTLFNAMTLGLRYFVYKEEISQLVMGRNCFNNQWGGTFATVLERIANGMAPGSISQSQMDLLRLTILQMKDRHQQATLDDSRVFYTSDMMVHARPTNHTVVRMLSNRTASLELGIGLETKNYHLGDGSTLFRIEGHEYEQSWPTANMTSVPGTTAEQKSGMPTSAATGTANSNNTFAGAVSDSRSMVGGFDLNKGQSYSTIRANKSYFFHDDIFAMLGSGIRQDGTINGDIWTTLNQVERKTDVTYNVGGNNVVVPLNSNSSRDFNNISSPVWFYQDGFGYIIVPESPINIKFWAETRTGRWSDVNSRESSKSINVNMFHLVINHGRNPQNDKYQYYVVPNTTPAQLANLLNNNPIDVISNNAAQQVAYHRNSKKGQFIFRTNNQRATLSSGLEMFSAKPTIIQTEETPDSLIVWVNDPNQSETSVQLRANFNLRGNGATWNVNTEETTINVSLPQGVYKGQAVRMAFAYGDQQPNSAPIADFEYAAPSFVSPAIVNFDASNSNDPDGVITAYEWVFEDGSTASGESAVRTYTNPGSYSVKLRVTDNVGALDSTEKIVVITEEVVQSSCTLPQNWLNADIGNPGAKGSACADNGTYTITATGDDAWGNSDQFQYMFTTMNGDGELIVRVLSMEQNEEYAKVGIMMRDNLNASSQHAHAFFHANMKYNGMQYRELNGDETFSAGTYTGSASLPYWLRMTRSGNTFRSYVSPDGNNWSLIGEKSISMGTQIYAGVTTTNKNYAGNTTSIVDNLSFSQTFDPGTFPVEFTNVQAIPMPHLKQVQLKWETASELNNSHFIVQKSLDGAIYEDLSQVRSQGNSNRTQKYTSIDENPYTGKAFYRIKQVDFSGLFSHSDVVEVKYDGDVIRSFTVFPNPIQQGSDFKFEAYISKVPSLRIEVRNSLGQVLYTQNNVEVSTDGSLLTTFNTSSLLPGKYLVTLSNPEYLDIPLTQKLVVLP